MCENKLEPHAVNSSEENKFMCNCALRDGNVALHLNDHKWPNACLSLVMTNSDKFEFSIKCNFSSADTEDPISIITIKNINFLDLNPVFANKVYNSSATALDVSEKWPHTYLNLNINVLKFHEILVLKQTM